MLPIVQRELQVAARNRNFYAWRLRVGILLILVSIGVVFFTRGGLRSGAGGGVFRLFCVLALLFSLVEGLRKTSDAISEEKREGTLGLLFLTALSGFDVIMGKLASAAVRSFNTLLAFMPILAISLLLGGTTGGEFWRMMLGLFLTLGASLSICVLTSTISRERSLWAAGAVMAGICFVPLAAAGLVRGPAGEWISAASPLALLEIASDAHYGRSPAVYWTAVAWLFAVSLLSVGGASALIPHSWRDRPKKPLGNAQLRRRLSPVGAGRRRAMLDRNPAMWLMFNTEGKLFLNIFAFFVGIGAFGAILAGHLLLWDLSATEEIHLTVAGVGAGLIVLAAHFFTAREASRNIAEARQNGALELILSTPLRVDDIVAGQMLAIRAALLWPAAIAGALSGYLLLYVLYLQQSTLGPGALLVVKIMVECVLGIFTVARFGLWMALTSKGATRAYLKTIAFGIVLPHIVCTPTVVNQVVLLVLAIDKVKVHFRRYVASRYGHDDSFSLSPVTPSKQEPPVLR